MESSDDNKEWADRENDRVEQASKPTDNGRGMPNPDHPPQQPPLLSIRAGRDDTWAVLQLVVNNHTGALEITRAMQIDNGGGVLLWTVAENLSPDHRRTRHETMTLIPRAIIMTDENGQSFISMPEESHAETPEESLVG